MDGDDNQVNTGESVSLAQESYSPPPAKGTNKLVVIGIVLALLALGVGVFFLLRSNTGEIETSPSPTSFVDEFTPEPSASPVTLNRSEIDIEILNGTGIAKEATYLADILKELGYENVTTGNLERQDPTVTEVTFAKGVPEAATQEITDKLEEIYKQVKTSTGTLAKGDVKIVVGLRKGATPKPSATATPKPTTSASPTASGSPTATPTATP